MLLVRPLYAHVLGTWWDLRAPLTSALRRSNSILSSIIINFYQKICNLHSEITHNHLSRPQQPLYTQQLHEPKYCINLTKCNRRSNTHNPSPNNCDMLIAILTSIAVTLITQVSLINTFLKSSISNNMSLIYTRNHNHSRAPA